MKVFRIVIGALFIILANNVYAAGLASTPHNSVSTVDQQLLKLFAVLSGCDLDEQCVVGMLNVISKSDPNPAINTFLQQLSQKKDVLDFNIKNCATQQTKAYKKTASECLTEAMTVNGKLVLDDKRLDEKGLQSCMFKKLENLANAGNIYAQVALAENALKQNDVNSHTYWINMARGQAKSPESGIFQQCAPGLNLILSAFVDTIKSLDRNMNVMTPKRQ